MKPFLDKAITVILAGIVLVTLTVTAQALMTKGKCKCIGVFCGCNFLFPDTLFLTQEQADFLNNKTKECIEENKKKMGNNEVNK